MVKKARTKVRFESMSLLVGEKKISFHITREGNLILEGPGATSEMVRIILPADASYKIINEIQDFMDDWDEDREDD